MQTMSCSDGLSTIQIKASAHGGLSVTRLITSAGADWLFKSAMNQ